MKWASALVAIALAQGGNVHLRGPASDVELRDFGSFSGALGPGKVLVTGAPVQLIWHDAGAMAQGGTISATTALDQNKDYFLSAAEISGSAAITWDTAKSFSWMADRTRASGGTPPSTPAARTQFTITTETISYAGEADQGTLSLPQAFTATYLADEAEAGSSLQVVGTSGNIAVWTHASENKSIVRKGTILGPVTLRFSRTERPAGKAPEVVEINAQGARLDIDMESEQHTLRLSGNVVIDGKGQGYTGNATAAEAVLLLGPKNELQELRMTGSPTKTRVEKSVPAGGGGR